jgi:hypothetical protein
MIRRVGAIIGTGMLCVPAILSAQAVVASAPQILVVQKAAVGSSLPSNTEVWVSLDNQMTSKKTNVGDKFDVTVSRDVMMGDYVIIPRGTHGHGQIAYRTGKGSFGKSAKMEFDLVDVKVGERFILIAGHYRLEGQGNTGATVGATVAFLPAGIFISGHSATAAQGSEWKAYTKEPILVAMAPAPAQPVMASASPSSAALIPVAETAAH